MENAEFLQRGSRDRHAKRGITLQRLLGKRLNHK